MNPPTFRIMFQPSFAHEKDELRAENEFLRQRVSQLEAGAVAFAVALAVTDSHVMLATGNGMMIELDRPPRMDVRRGHILRLRQGGQAPPAIIAIATDYAPVGPTFVVKQLVGEDSLEVEVNPGQTKVIFFTGDAPKPGDRVVLDQSAQVVVKNLGQGDRARVVMHATGVDWDDIGGQDEAKSALREAIEEPVLHREMYAQYKLTPARGVLLHGRPGNGKTMLGKAAATALARVHHKAEASSGFIYVKGPDLLNRWVGESEKNIRELFVQARAHHDEHGYPAIIFLDEADALLTKRGQNHQGMERTIVPQFLSEMDGMFASSAFVLLATNRPDTLDPAVVREGRIDRKVEVKAPDRRAAKDIAMRRLKDRPCARGGVEGRADDVVGELFADRRAVYMIRCRDGGDRRFPLGELVSGAMVAGVVERATQLAIRRDVAREAGPLGITTGDVVAAVDAVLEEQRAMSHEDELREFCKPFADKVVKIEKPSARETESLIKLS